MRPFIIIKCKSFVQNDRHWFFLERLRTRHTEGKPDLFQCPAAQPFSGNLPHPVPDSETFLSVIGEPRVFPVCDFSKYLRCLPVYQLNRPAAHLLPCPDQMFFRQIKRPALFLQRFLYLSRTEFIDLFLQISSSNFLFFPLSLYPCQFPFHPLSLLTDFIHILLPGRFFFVCFLPILRLLPDLLFMYRPDTSAFRPQFRYDPAAQKDNPSHSDQSCNHRKRQRASRRTQSCGYPAPYQPQYADQNSRRTRQKKALRRHIFCLLYCLLRFRLICREFLCPGTIPVSVVPSCILPIVFCPADLFHLSLLLFVFPLQIFHIPLQVGAFLTEFSPPVLLPILLFPERSCRSLLLFFQDLHCPVQIDLHPAGLQIVSRIILQSFRKLLSRPRLQLSH